MNHNDYEKIVQNIIKPLTSELLTTQNNQLYHAVNLTKEFDEKLFNKINKYISYIKNNIVITQEMDVHKMSACLMCAIVDYYPFTISKKGYNCEDLFFANELLGVYSAISLLECYNSNLKITFPETTYTTREVPSYVRTLCTSLFICKNNRQLKYSILNYANILFLLEHSSSNNNSQ